MTTSADLKQVNLRLRPETLRIARVLSAHAGLSLAKFLEGTIDTEMASRAELAVQAALERAEHFRREADELKEMGKSEMGSSDALAQITGSPE